MKFFRIFPEMWASTIWPFGSFTRNIVPGKTSTTTPSLGMQSSFAIGIFLYHTPCTRATRAACILLLVRLLCDGILTMHES